MALVFGETLRFVGREHFCWACFGGSEADSLNDGSIDGILDGSDFCCGKFVGGVGVGSEIRDCLVSEIGDCWLDASEDFEDWVGIVDLCLINCWKQFIICSFSILFRFVGFKEGWSDCWCFEDWVDVVVLS